jgi:hypothetical protein
MVDAMKMRYYQPFRQQGVVPPRRVGDGGRAKRIGCHVLEAIGVLRIFGSLSNRRGTADERERFQ